MKRPKYVITQGSSSLIFNLNSVSAENRRLLNQLYITTTKKHQEMSRAIELCEKNNKLRRQLEETQHEADYLRESNIKLKNWNKMSYAYDKIKAIQHENDVLRYEIALSKLKRTEASNNAEKMAEENYYLEKKLTKLRDEVVKLRHENDALSSRRYPQF